MPAVPRVLWVTEEPPDRNLGGGNIRQAHLLTALARRTPTELVLAGHLGDDETRAALAGLIEVLDGKRAPRTTSGRRVRDVLMAAGAGPAEAYVNRPTRRALRHAISGPVDRADLVVVSHQGLAPLLPATRRGVWVAQLHHVSTERTAQELATVTGGRQRWLLSRELAQAAALERWLVNRYDGICVPSGEDARILGSPAERTLIVPNGVDLDRFPPAPLPAEPHLLLPGSLDYRPNVDGAIWFCREVWPPIRAAVPGARLDVVGRSPVRDVTALAGHAGVRVHADVASMVPWLERARVVVVPLRIGTGTRLKALEAMAARRPVVGTTIGLAGLGISGGSDAVIADRAADMAAAVVELLADDRWARSLAAAGRRLVERRFQWAAIAEEFATRILELAGGPTRPFPAAPA